MDKKINSPKKKELLIKSKVIKKKKNNNQSDIDIERNNRIAKIMENDIDANENINSAYKYALLSFDIKSKKNRGTQRSLNTVKIFGIFFITLAFYH